MAALAPMTQNDDPNAILTERFERRLTEETGRLRVEIMDGFGKLRIELAELRGDFKELRGDMRADMSSLRAEMVRANTAMLKWMLVFFVSQAAATAAFIRLFR